MSELNLPLFEYYLIHTLQPRKNKLHTDYGNTHTNRATRISKRLKLVIHGRYPTDASSHAYLSDHLVCCDTIDNDSMIVVGNNDGMHDGVSYYGALVDCKTLVPVKPVFGLSQVDKPNSIHNVKVKGSYVAAINSIESIMLGKVHNDVYYFAIADGLRSKSDVSYACLTANKNMAKDEKAFYFTVDTGDKIWRVTFDDIDRLELFNHAGDMLDPIKGTNKDDLISMNVCKNKASDQLPFGLIIEIGSEIQDLCTTDKYLVVNTARTVEVRDRRLFRLKHQYIEKDDSASDFTSTSANESCIYVSQGKSLKAFNLHNMKLSAQAILDIEPRRRLTINFVFKGVSFIGILVDMPSQVAIICHVRHRLTLCAKLDARMPDIDSCRVFGMCYLPAIDTLVVTNERRNSVTIKLTQSN